MTNQILLKNCAITIISMAILSTLISCGPSKEELAIRKAQQIELENRRSLLARKVQQRIEAGEQPPPKINDPGHRLADCKITEAFLNSNQAGITKDGLLVIFIFGEGAFICVNNDAGQRLLSYREWYCEGEDESCVLSEWKDGQPTFGEYLTSDTHIDLGNNARAYAAPVQTRSPK